MTRIIEYAGTTDSAPVYAPSTPPRVKDYETDAPASSVLSKSVEIQFIPTRTSAGDFAPSPASSSTPGVYSPPAASSPSPVSSSSPSSSSIASSPVSVPVIVQPQITRSTDSARQTRRLQMSGSQVAGTVTNVSPLKVVVDGATVDSLANVLDGATYTLGARVAVLIRNPQMPLVQGVLS